MDATVSSAVQSINTALRRLSLVIWCINAAISPLSPDVLRASL